MGDSLPPDSDDPYATPLADLGIEPQYASQLAALGVNTLGDLVTKVSDQELKDMPGIGQEGYRNVSTMLHALGYFLGHDPQA